MTTQIIGIKHRGSGIKQAIFHSEREGFKFQGVSPHPQTPDCNKVIDREEALNTLRVWRDLQADDNLVVTHEDVLTMRWLAGCDHLEMVTGAAPEQEYEEEHVPNEEGFSLAPFDPEAQADLELHNQLHPSGYQS